MIARLIFQCPACNSHGIITAIFLENGLTLKLHVACIPCNAVFQKEYDLLEIAVNQEATKEAEA